MHITWYGLTIKKLKLLDGSEKLPKFGLKESKLGIAYTKSCEVKTQFDVNVIRNLNDSFSIQ